MEQTEYSLGAEQAILELGSFKGLQTKLSTYYISPPHSRVCSGFVFNEEVGNLLSFKGRANLGTSGATGEQINSLARMYRGTSVPWIVYSTNNKKLRYMTDAGVDAAFTPAIALTSNNAASFVQWSNYVFFCNGVDTPQKIKTDNTMTRAGIATPLNNPTVAQGAAGVLNGNYTYRLTYQSATHESSPTAITGANITVVNKKVDLSNIPVSSDAQVTQVNIYRLGGTSTIWSYIGQVANGVTTFTDNVADSAVGTTLTLNRDPPSATCKQFIIHKNRLWGVTDTTVDPSNFNEPEGFNSSYSVKIDNSSSGDINVRACVVGSLLLVGRRQSTYAIFGENAGEFIPKKVFDIGLVAPLSLVSDGDLAIGLFEDGVRTFNGTKFEIISEVMESTLTAISRANRELMCGEIHDKVYYLSSSEEGKTWFYDVRTGEWGELPWGCPVILSLTGNQDPETIIGVRSSDKLKIDKWFQGGMDLGSNLSFDWKTDRLILSKAHLYRARELHILMDSNSVPFTITVTYDNTRVDTLSITPSLGEYQVATLSDKAIGHDIQVEISGAVNDNTKRLRVFYLWFFGWIERRHK